jgi:hypothetical protein
MLSDVRIRLEGRVEQVERALWAWESAARSLNGNAWRSGTLFGLLDAIAPELEESVRVLQRKVSQAPELQVLLDRLRIAKSQVRQRAVVRLSQLGVQLRSNDLAHVLAELRVHHPIIHEERLGWSPRLMHSIAFAGVAVTLALLVMMSPLAMLTSFITVMFTARRWLASQPVLLTARTLVVGGRAVPLNEVLYVNARSGLDRSGTRCEIEVVSRNQPVWRISSTGDPGRLMDKLPALGIRCKLETGLFFFW